MTQVAENHSDASVTQPQAAEAAPADPGPSLAQAPTPSGEANNAGAMPSPGTRGLIVMHSTATWLSQQSHFSMCVE